MPKDYLKAVPKRGSGKPPSETETLIDMLKYVSDIKQELYELLESVELLEEDVKQTLYKEQGSKKGKT